jgi:hypothetical protein
VFSACSVQDYLAWNRARWVAVDRLTDRYGADPLQIDGGYEYNGLHTSDVFMKRNNTSDFRNQGPLAWWVLDDTYAISFLPRAGYQELDRVTYFSALGMERRDLLILRKRDALRQSPDAPGPPPTPDVGQEKPPMRMLLP